MSESRIKTRSFYRRQLDGLNFPKHLEGQKIMRVVFRPDMSDQMTGFLCQAMDRAYEDLTQI
jgi:hypothetical protein